MLAAAAVPEYIAGLRETGWRGRDSDVRAGFGLSAIRHVFMLGLLKGIVDPERQESFARSTGQLYSDAVARAGYRTAFLLDLLEND